MSWFFYDKLGNVQGTSDMAGDLVEAMDQDAYGNVLSSIETGQWASTFSGRHLTTKEYDPDSELYYFYGRHYDPQTGLFTSVEILNGTRTRYPYDYCYDNPLSYIDSTGSVPLEADPDPTPFPTPGIPEGECIDSLGRKGRAVPNPNLRAACHHCSGIDQGKKPGEEGNFGGTICLIGEIGSGHSFTVNTADCSAQECTATRGKHGHEACLVKLNLCDILKRERRNSKGNRKRTIDCGDNKAAMECIKNCEKKARKP